MHAHWADTATAAPSGKRSLTLWARSCVDGWTRARAPAAELQLPECRCGEVRRAGSRAEYSHWSGAAARGFLVVVVSPRHGADVALRGCEAALGGPLGFLPWCGASPSGLSGAPSQWAPEGAGGAAGGCLRTSESEEAMAAGPLADHPPVSGRAPTLCGRGLDPAFEAWVGVGAPARRSERTRRKTSVILKS